VVLKEIDPSKRRISLSMKDAEGDPWLEAAAKYAPGTQVTGVVEKRETFGIFVSLEPGITALLPKSRISVAVDPKQFDKLNRGDSVTLVVEDLRAGERRIALSPLEVRENAGQEGGGGGRENNDWKAYAKPARAAKGEDKAASSGGMGSLGDMLAQAMKGKK
jgi:small subunit ribosomal protein S1